MADETQLEVAARVEEVKHTIIRQQALIARLVGQGIPVEAHRQTLRILEIMLAWLEDREQALRKAAHNQE